MKKTFVILAALTFTSLAAQAQVLMLDFGPTVVSGTNVTNSPYHTADLSFSGTAWNQVQTADIGSGLLWADGTSAAGLSLNLGATTTTTVFSSTLNLTSVPSGNNALGAATNTGIYAGTSVGTDGIFTGASGTRAVGFQLSGLTAGTYEVYVTARNTNLSGSYSPTVFVGASSASGNFVLNGPGMLSESLTIASASAATAAWADDSNYLKFTVTVNSGDVLNLASLGGGGDGRGFLNSVQIVAVPEPAASLLAGLGLGFAVLRRRRRLA